MKKYDTTVTDIVTKLMRGEYPRPELRVNWTNLNIILSAAAKDSTTVPLSPIGRNRFLKGDDNISMSDRITVQEATALAEMIIFGYKYYGEPVFDYFAVDETRFEDVDFWRNLIKLGREVSPNSGSKRISNLKRLLTHPEGGKIDPNWDHLVYAIDTLRHLYTHKLVSRDKHTFNLSYSIDKSSTNSGDPMYMRKVKLLDGVPVRSIVERLSKSLDWDAQMGQPAFLGARSQRGQWALIDGSKYSNVHELIHKIYNFGKDKLVKELLNNIAFTNAKSRVISAAPSNWTYTVSPIMFELIEYLKESDTSYQLYLRGPESVKEMLWNFRRIREYFSTNYNIQLMSFNNDVPSYDSTLRSFHGDIVYTAMKDIFPVAKDKALLANMIAVSLSRQIQYIEEPLPHNSSVREVISAVKVQRSEDLKSGEPDTNWFGSTNLFICLYAARRESMSGWDKIFDVGLSKFNTSTIQTDGDDNLSLYLVSDDGTIKEDLTQTSSILSSKLGLLEEDPARKGELGEFYTQFRLTFDGRFIAILSRMNLYWSESDKRALPTYVYVLSLWQQLEYRWDCKGVIEFITTFILPYEKTKLGLVDVDTGELLTLSQIRAKLRDEETANSKSIKEMLSQGNPYDDRLFDDKGDISLDWLSQQYDRILPVVKDYLHKK